MKYRIIVLLTAVTTLFMSSCIKDEALNTEADIETASIPHGDQVLQVKPSIGDDRVVFRLKRFSGSYLQAPEFTLTGGATIEPASGTEQDFFTPKQYKVTSQDGVWSKTYTVSFIIDDVADFYSTFENAEVVEAKNPTGFYHQFFELTTNNQKKYDWATANQGYNMLAETLLEPGEKLEPSVYPTVQVNGYIGKGVKMTTKSTGPLGGMFGSPLAAGNLFVGNFELSFPAINSTRFGLPYNAKKAPVALKGFFKYKAGEKFVVNTAPSQLTTDTWDAYAILFEKSTNGNDYLSGTHAFKDARMVSVARIGKKEQIETNEWTAFEIPFSFVNGNSFDPTKEYMYTIVFSSSREGDLFNGAVGSTLYIDEVELVVDQTK
ncbi:PCMD domain-containing protein [Sphingobacterium tabacisoli]|uniref:PCMD domain-containing protein n=1 Tax=Sphingobacterium tabacisoli TaxID=2044855 RepID=A0ABW5KYZ8_9SPHI|nr:PCMD domain-containing protein [Sphingobacterium tabacisoli]